MSLEALSPERRARLKRILNLAVPLIFVHLGQALLGLTDTLFLGHLGAEPLAAASLGNVIFFSALVLGLGFVMAGDPLISQAVGKDDPLKARYGLRAALAAGFVVGFMVSAFTFGALLILPHFFDHTVAAATGDYLLGRFFGFWFFYLYLALKSYLQAYSVTFPALVAVIVCNLINIPLDGLLIYGDTGLESLGLVGIGIPALGVLGSGIASALASLVGFLWLLPTVLKHMRNENVREGGVVSRWKKALTPERIQTLIKVGLPLSMQLFWEVGMFAAITFMMGQFSTEDLAGHQVALQLGSTPFNVVLGIGAAASVLVGNEIGKENAREALLVGTDAIILGALFMGFCSLFFFFFPGPLARLFTSDAAVIETATVLIQLAGAYAIFDGLQAVAAGCLRGAGDTFFAFLGHALACWGFGIPSAYVLGFVLKMGPPGLWWGLTIGLAAAGFILTARFLFAGKRGYAALE